MHTSSILLQAWHLSLLLSNPCSFSDTRQHELLGLILLPFQILVIELQPLSQWLLLLQRGDDIWTEQWSTFLLFRCRLKRRRLIAVANYLLRTVRGSYPADIPMSFCAICSASVISDACYRTITLPNISCAPSRQNSYTPKKPICQLRPKSANPA